MLGLFGFLALALMIGVYAYTFYTYYPLVPLREKRLFINAYALLGVSALLWAGTFLAPEEAVSGLVFTSDILLVVATGCMLGVLIPDLAKPRLLVPLVLAGAGLLTVRAFVAPPNAYVADNLLIFNLLPIESLVIGLIFLIAWLPATIKIIHLGLRSPELAPFRNIVSFLFMSAVLMTGLFLTARRPVMIILSFGSIIVLFATLAAVNVMLERVDQFYKKQKVQHG